MGSGVEITRIGISDKWSKVIYNGIDGYVSNDYIKIKENEIIPEEPTEC